MISGILAGWWSSQQIFSHLIVGPNLWYHRWRGIPADHNLQVSGEAFFNPGVDGIPYFWIISCQTIWILIPEIHIEYWFALLLPTDQPSRRLWGYPKPVSTLHHLIILAKISIGGIFFRGGPDVNDYQTVPTSLLVLNSTTKSRSPIKQCHTLWRMGFKAPGSCFHFFSSDENRL